MEGVLSPRFIQPIKVSTGWTNSPYGPHIPPGGTPLPLSGALPKDSPIRELWSHFTGENKGTNEYIYLINGPKEVYSEHELNEISYFWSADTAVNTADARDNIIKALKNFPESSEKQTIISEANRLTQVAVKILESHIQDRDIATLVGLVTREQIKAVNTYANFLASQTNRLARNAGETLSRIYQESAFLKNLGEAVSNYCHTLKDAFTTLQKEAATDLIILTLLPPAYTPEEVAAKVSAGLRLLNSYLIVAPGVSAVALALLEETIIAAKVLPHVGATIAEELCAGLSANKNAVVQAEVAEIVAEAKQIVDSAGKLKIPSSDLKRVLNDAHHIFEPTALARHKLSGVLEKFGGDQIHAFKALEEATQILANEGKISGIYTTTVVIKDTIVIVKGKVIDGIARIGTAYIP